MKFSPYIFEPDKSLDVYKQTEVYFKNNTELKIRIEELGWIYHTTGMIIPHTFDNFWSGHYMPFMDSWNELQISFNLICFGFYKQAFASLRSGLELGLLSVYFNINDEGHNEIKEWLNSKENTPRKKALWKRLKQNENIKKFNDIHNLEQVHEDLGYLHDYVHTKGFKYSNQMGMYKGNFQTFEEKLISKWLESYNNIISLISTLHLLKYPISIIRFDYNKKFGVDIPNFGGLEEYNIDKIASILPEKYLEDIEKIADEDSLTQRLLEEIKSFPDLTEEEVEEQIINLEKLSIEHGLGFNNWYETQEKVLKMLGSEMFSDKMKIRIEILKKWAEENNYMDSLAIRLGVNIKI